MAAKRPAVSHLFTPAAAGCHWESEGEIPWFYLPFVTVPPDHINQEVLWEQEETGGLVYGYGPGQLHQWTGSGMGDNSLIKSFVLVMQ